MPTSTYSQIPALVNYLHILRPTSILDIGLGNGKMGFIARDLLDVMLGQRYHRRDWQVRIDGIEVFEDYVQDHQRAIYDDIHIGDAFEVIDRLGHYQLVIIGDVLEHFDRDRATAFLDKAAAHADAMILSIPLGPKWTQDDIYGNDFERHRSFWSPEDFTPMATHTQLIEFPGLGPYGSFLIHSNSFRHHQARQRADGLAAAGSVPAGLAELQFAAAMLAPDLGTELLMAEMHLRLGDRAGAIASLERTLERFPDQESIPTYLTQLRRAAAA